MADRVARTYGIALCVGLIVWTIGADAAPPQNVPAEGVSTTAARQDATRALPLNGLSAGDQQLVRDVIQNTAVYRSLPRQTIDCEPDLYLSLLRNPELVVNMWSTMGITKMAMERTANGDYRVADGQGTKGNVRVLYADDHTHLIYSDGSYTGALAARAIRGRCVLLLRSRYGQDQRGRMLVSSDLDMFLAIDNIGVELLAKTFQSTIGKTADHNFAETTAFVSKLSKTSEINPDAVVRLVDRLQNVQPPVKEEFNTLVRQTEPKLRLAKQAYEERVAARQNPQPAMSGNMIRPAGQPAPVAPQPQGAQVPLRQPIPVQPTARR